MSTGYRRGTVVVACLLLTGCLSAGLASDDSAAPVRVLSSRGLASPVNHGSPVTPSPMVLDTVYDNDVGVTAITTPAGLFCFCDTIRPLTCRVSNFGTANQTGVPVTCRPSTPTWLRVRRSRSASRSAPATSRLAAATRESTTRVLPRSPPTSYARTTRRDRRSASTPWPT